MEALFVVIPHLLLGSLLHVIANVLILWEGNVVIDIRQVRSVSRHRATEKSKSDDGTFPKSYEKCLFSPLYFGKCTIENTTTSLAECKSCVHVFQLDSSDDGCHQKKRRESVVVGGRGFHLCR